MQINYLKLKHLYYDVNLIGSSILPSGKTLIFKALAFLQLRE